MKTFKSILIAALFLTVSNGLMAQADATGDISATASVVASAEVSKVSDLSFGNVDVATDKEILPGGQNSGQFGLRTNAGGNIAFTFPTHLTATIGGQTRNLPVSFDGLYVQIDGKDNTGTDISSPAYNPVTTPTYSLTSNNFDLANDFTIYVGGIVSPEANQASGDYSGTVTLSVTFN